MANLSVNNSKLKNRVQEHPTYTFYKKYFWKQIAADHATSGRILRTIYCQFGNWCVEKGFRFGDDDLTKLCWLKRIVPFLCYKNPCIKILRGHTNCVRSVIKLNETTIVSGSMDRTLRVWDLTNNIYRVLSGHTNCVNSVIKLNETTIISGSMDRTIRIWDLTDNISRVLTGHTNCVNSVSYTHLTLPTLLLV